MKQKLAYISSLAALLAAFACLTALAPEAAGYAGGGLRLCAEAVVPALFPFFVLSGLASALGLPRLLGRLLGRPMRLLFGVSGESAAPLLLGLIGGYPVGAAAVAALVRDGSVTAAEGERLLPFCNNTGPAFILGAAGAGVFGSVRCGLLLYVCHILAAVAVGVLFSLGHRSATPERPISPIETPSLAAALPGAVRTAAANLLSLCGFVVFFAVLSGMLETLGAFSTLAGGMAERLGWALRPSLALLRGVLELSGGIGAMRGLPATAGNLALAAFLLGFGGLSVHCQTLAAVEGTGMKCARHFAGRALHGVCSAVFAFVLFRLLRI